MVAVNIVRLEQLTLLCIIVVVSVEQLRGSQGIITEIACRHNKCRIRRIRTIQNRLQVCNGCGIHFCFVVEVREQRKGKACPIFSHENIGISKDNFQCFLDRIILCKHISSVCKCRCRICFGISMIVSVLYQNIRLHHVEFIVIRLRNIGNRIYKAYAAVILCKFGKYRIHHANGGRIDFLCCLSLSGSHQYTELHIRFIAVYIIAGNILSVNFLGFVKGQRNVHPHLTCFINAECSSVNRKLRLIVIDFSHLNIGNIDISSIGEESGIVRNRSTAAGHTARRSDRTENIIPVHVVIAVIAEYL